MWKAKLNDMCNRSGLDTISAGTVIAFAMECFEIGGEDSVRQKVDGICTVAQKEGVIERWKKRMSDNETAGCRFRFD